MSAPETKGTADWRRNPCTCMPGLGWIRAGAVWRITSPVLVCGPRGHGDLWNQTERKTLKVWVESFVPWKWPYWDAVFTKTVSWWLVKMTFDPQVLVRVRWDSGGSFMVLESPPLHSARRMEASYLCSANLSIPLTEWYLICYTPLTGETCSISPVTFLLSLTPVQIYISNFM